MAVERLTLERIFELMDERKTASSTRAKVIVFFNTVVSRGDGLAAYENKALDSAKCGDILWMSYGKSPSLIEAETGEDLPLTAPEAPSTPWAYQLVGYYPRKAEKSPSTTEPT